MLTPKQREGCRRRALAEARAGRTRGVSLAWLEAEQRETERAFKEGWVYQVAREHTLAELIRLEELKWLPFRRVRYESAWGGGMRSKAKALRRGPSGPSQWMYWRQSDKAQEPSGPVTLQTLLGLIKSRKLSEETMVVPTDGSFSGWHAWSWRQIAPRLPLNLPELCRTWVRGSARKKWPARDWWAWEKATRLVETDPELGWRVISALVAAAPSESVLANIGALYVEDYVQMYPAHHARVVARAKRDAKFRRCLAHVRRMHLTARMLEAVGARVPPGCPPEMIAFTVPATAK